MKVKGPSTGGTPTLPPATTSSAAAAAAVPVQDKYKKKLKDLKRKNREIEEENDRLVLKITRARKDVERLRAERGFLFQKLEEFDMVSKGDFSGDHDGPLTMFRTGGGGGVGGGVGGGFLDDENEDFLDVEGISSAKPTPVKKSGLTVVLPGGAAGSAAAKKPEKDPNAPKKAMNAFKVYCQYERARDREKFSKMVMADQTRALGAAWKILSIEDKKVRSSFFSQKLDGPSNLPPPPWLHFLVL